MSTDAPSATILPFRRALCIPVQIGTGLSRVVWKLTLDDEDGRGFVSLIGEDFAASYYWPRPNRGANRTLPDFLFGVDISYFAGKMNTDKWFDSAGTEKLAREWLAEQLEGNDEVDRDDFASLLDPSFHSMRDWEEWCSAVDGAGISEAWYSGTSQIVRPDVRRFYEAAWPMLKARRAEIEAELYGATLHVFTNGPDHVIAYSPEDATALRNDPNNGLCPWAEGYEEPLEWKQVPDHREIRVGGDHAGNLRADQWARAMGRSILCSEEWA